MAEGRELLDGLDKYTPQSEVCLQDTINTWICGEHNSMDSLKYGREMRKHQRLQISLPIEYQKMHDSCPCTGLALNLSKAGLQFYCRGEMGVGTSVMITIMFADGCELTSFEVCARIVWKDLYFEKDWSEYRYGAEFINLTEEDQGKLDMLLNAYVFEESSGDPAKTIFRTQRRLLTHWHNVFCPLGEPFGMGFQVYEEAPRAHER